MDFSENGIQLYCLDVESSGTDSKRQEITEISIIRVKDRVQLTEFVKCDYPERASLDALKITNKTFDDLLKGSSKEDMVAKVNKFFDEDGKTPAHRCIVGHNVQFDRKFVFSTWEKVGQEFPAHLWLDTLSMTKAWLKKADTSQLNIVKTATGRISTKLRDCCDLVDIPRYSDQHNSKIDTRNTYLLFKKLIEEKNIDHLPFFKTFEHKITKDDLINLDELDLSEVY